jgi:hypothetical protein
MQLTQQHVNALTEAETLMFHSDFCPYLELKTLLSNATPQARSQFRILFTNYYGLNTGGLTQAFKDKYFAILHSGKIFKNQNPRFHSILRLLHKIPRKKGDKAMQFSFVSKLAAMHDEKSPIYDRHVLNFFGKKARPPKTSMADRITWYVEFLNQVATDYTQWSQDARVTPILTNLKNRDQRLAQCDVIRLMDFLVWKVGNQKLL